MDGKRVILAAHRGDRASYPENTMMAFRSAVDLGADMIETDIRMTKDGELILIHDRSALRTCGVDVNVDELTLAELQALDAGRGEKIPTVREFMDFLKGNDILVNWELKVYPRDFGEEYAYLVADKLISMIDEYELSERSMLNSFSVRVLEYIYKKYPTKFPIHGQGIHNCRRSHEDATIPEHELFDWCCLYPDVPNTSPLDYKENFDYCNDMGVLPCICIADTFEAYRLALDYGCRMFTSNNIALADEILRKLGAR